MRQWLLLLRFALFNIVGFGFVAAIWLQGWLNDAIAGHTGWLVGAIALAFVYGFILCCIKVISVSRDLIAVREGRPRPGSRSARYLSDIRDQAASERMLRANLLRLRLTNEVVGVRHMANTLVFFGLVGTIIGFIIALTGVDAEAASSADKIAPMVTTLISGMSIALYTTLIGAVFHVWLTANYRLLSGGSLALFDATVDLGERRVGR